MSDTRDPDTDQPLPVTNDRPFVQDLVIADMEERKALGIQKYGTPLQSGNGRDMLLDAYQEALDLTVYVRGLMDERERAEHCVLGIQWQPEAAHLPGLVGPFDSVAEAETWATTNVPNGAWTVHSLASPYARPEKP